MEYIEHELKNLIQYNRPEIMLAEKKSLIYQVTDLPISFIYNLDSLGNSAST